MKKIFLIVAVLMLATPALAVITVDIEAVQGDDANKVEIWYTVTPATTDCEDGNRPRAFGLNVSVDSGEITGIEDYFLEGECGDVNKGYGIFPGTISISGDEISNIGTPVAPNDAPGAEGTGLDTNTIVVEMGSLYVDDNCPPDSARLFTIIVNMNCNVSVEGNAARTGTASPEGKGVVMENLSEVYELTVDWPSPFPVTGLSVAVPDVLPMDLTEATTAIEGVGLVVALPVTYECNDTEAAEEILAQAPAGGTMANPGSAVDLWVSDGQPVVPPVVDTTQAAAEAAINAVDYISVGNITTECSCTIAAGNVISQSAVGTVTCGTEVDLVVSTGGYACSVPWHSKTALEHSVPAGRNSRTQQSNTALESFLSAHFRPMARKEE